MREARQERYGGPEVVELHEVPRPAPGVGQVLVEVRAASLTPADTAMRKARPFITRFFTGLIRPRNLVLGSEFSGVVVAVGEGVTRFAVGEAIYGSTAGGFGAHRDYLVVGENDAVVPKPEGLSHEGAAGLAYSFLTAMPFLRDEAQLAAGQRILVNGASGSIGLVAVQLAKHMGAHVTGVASGRNEALVRAQGADAFIDYEQVDFTATTAAWDVIFDAVGKSSFRRCRRALAPAGIYLTTVPSLAIVWAMLAHRRQDRPRGRLATTGLRPTSARRADLELIAPLVAAGALRPVIDRSYPLERIAEAHAYVDTERKRGEVLITPVPDPV